MLVNFQTDLAAYARTILPPGLNRLAGITLDYLHRRCLGHPSIRKVLYPSQSSRLYLEQLGVPAAKLVQVGRGVDTELFNPARRDLELRRKLAPNNEVILLCVARLSLEKGFDFLAQAARQLAEEGGVPFKLVIVGGNLNPAIEKTIQGLFGEMVGRQVIFTGVKHGIELASLYASADVFVYSSLTETFGQVIQEAMASGLPVVARRKGGPADIVQPGKTGYLTSPHDLDEFVAGVSALILRPQLRSELGCYARRLAGRATWNRINHQIACNLAAALNPGPGGT